MYCIKCGVELADTEEKCPLCATVVYHPELARHEAEPLYPAGRYPISKNAFRILPVCLSVLVLAAALIVLLCDLRVHSQVTWCGYVIGALFVGFVIGVLPMWFRKPNPVIFVPCGFAAVGLYLLYINLFTGGNWFMSFAFPVTGGICLIVTAVVTLLRYVKRGKLYIVGGALIALGGFALLMEFLSNLTFHVSRFLGWSLYPLIALVLLGGLLIYLGISRTAREIMKRKLFF